MHVTTGTFETKHASKYLQQLCKHFGHKIDVEYDQYSGRAVFPLGIARFDANAEKLTVRIEFKDAALEPQAHGVIDSHLVTFAFRENFTKMNWETIFE